ncbi:DUF4202 family protein [Candidatus Dojkabacteria bacterium]|nr:DUF4202 family protein [Candidatus Dojkabacteria bacterium]
MPDGLFEKVKAYVVKVFTNKGSSAGIPHLERTVYWVKQLNSDADEALLIAAIGHDIERPLRTEAAIERIKDSPKGYMSEEHLKEHQTTGAKIIAEFLKENEADPDLIERVKMLISKHEVGGNDDQNLLKDADSISFFETNAEHFLTKYLPVVGADKVKEKFEWMYSRITSEQAKKIARPMYKKVMDKLLTIETNS